MRVRRDRRASHPTPEAPIEHERRRARDSFTASRAAHNQRPSSDEPQTRRDRSQVSATRNLYAVPVCLLPGMAFRRVRGTVSASATVRPPTRNPYRSRTPSKKPTNVLPLDVLPLRRLVTPTNTQQISCGIARSSRANITRWRTLVERFSGSHRAQHKIRGNDRPGPRRD